MAEIAIRTTTGELPVAATGSVWAVHPIVGADNVPDRALGWAVTHAPTGLRAVKVTTREKAQRIARELRTLPPCPVDREQFAPRRKGDIVASPKLRPGQGTAWHAWCDAARVAIARVGRSC